MNHENLIFVKEYFRTKGHDFNRDANFTIIERIEKVINIKSMIKKRKKKTSR